MVHSDVAAIDRLLADDYRIQMTWAGRSIRADADSYRTGQCAMTR